ncbi:class I SAM-dependent methyltransferase [Pseudomonas pseudonitroreducens]|uniref:class I SAM-dependent methyltransferase n=1 Tax=Pseudomonas pseudonitroreducens TaxID=2892326 RepID=UPI001F3EC6A4|nr:class I SAM-dependent methyltransferase [Pseudomonas pseudonitroreducens]
MSKTANSLQRTDVRSRRTSRCYPQSAPENLAVLAWLFGLKAPKVETARVLELGCADGGNLIPFATRHRRATAVGVDLSPESVEDGLERIEHLGLGNIRLQAAALTDIGAKLGEFDYIICHGLYSYVTPQERQAIARICKEHLSANGVAYVSSNTYPGWKGRELVRDAMLLRLSGRSKEGYAAAEARGMFDFLKQWKGLGDGVLEGALKECEPLCADDYRLSAFLDPSNVPCYFSDFIQRFEAQGMTYLAEAYPAGMFISNYPAGVQKALLGECGHSQVALEQYLDILTNRSSRQTLLVHADRANSIRYRISPERLAKLHVSARFECEEAVRLEDGEQYFLVADGRRIGLHNAVMKVAAYRLNEVWPRTQNLPALRTFVEQQLGELPEGAEAQLIDLFEHIVVTGLGRYRLSAVVGGPGAQGMPRVDPEVIAYAQLNGDEHGGITFNPWHEQVTLDPFSALLLPHLDGCHTQDELLEVIADGIAEERLGFLREGQPITDQEELGRTGVLHLHRVLESLLA